MANEGSFCHAFLSFRGETRSTFTCFLYDALKAEGFKTFMDKEVIRVGDEVDSRIQQGIKGSMSAIVIFSQNYASSTWCLNERLLILERKRTSRYFIIPIFYEVEPAEIRHQLGNYGAALRKHKGRHRDDKVEKWRQALVEVANILGEHVQGTKSNFIQNIVKLFRQMLSLEFPECRLPLPINPAPQGNPSSSSPRDTIVLYTTEPDNIMGSNALVKSILRQSNVVFEERNCSKDPNYITELEKLVGKERVKFPTLIVNGKDLCGEEEVQGLEGFAAKNKLKGIMNILDTTERSVEFMKNRWGMEPFLDYGI